MQAQCCVGSGLLCISCVIILPSLVCSANHLPAEPATGCQPSSTTRGSWLMLTSPGGTTLGLLPSPSSCCRVSLALSTLPLLGCDQPLCTVFVFNVKPAYWPGRSCGGKGKGGGALLFHAVVCRLTGSFLARQSGTEGHPLLLAHPSPTWWP